MGGGRVWLVGAGPGAADLLTLRAMRCLQQADVVVHDRLVSAEVLGFVRPAAERINVGKHAYAESCSQTVINALLIERAASGAQVVRLKGGDPLIFGRGAEEAHALACAGIPFEIVPGLSSVLAAPAAAGIPLTCRGVAHTFTVATGTGVHGAALDDRELEHLASGTQTLVFLMGVHRLDHLIEGLMRFGRPPCEPCAIIMHATWSTQRTVFGSLGDIAETARTQSIIPPAVLVVGPTVDRALLTSGVPPEPHHS